MKNKLTAKLLTAGILLSSVFLPSPSTAQPHRNVYSCINKNGVPLTVVDTEKGRVELIVWKSDYFRASNWTPQRRCDEVSRRFQQFNDSKRLKYITTGTMNNYPVVCVGKLKAPQGYDCEKDGLLITLQAGDNANQVLKSLFTQANNVSGGGTPVSRDPDGKEVFTIENYLAKYPYQDFPQQGNNYPQTREEKYPQTQETSCPSIFCND